MILWEKKVHQPIDCLGSPYSAPHLVYMYCACFNTVWLENLEGIIFGEMASKRPKINIGDIKFGDWLIRKFACGLIEVRRPKSKSWKSFS